MDKASPSLETLDLDAIRSRVTELTELHRSCCRDEDFEIPSSDSEMLLKECVLHLEGRVKQIVSEYSDVNSLGNEDLDAYIENLKDQLQMVENENDKITNEIEDLTRTVADDSNKLECDLDMLKFSLDFISKQGLEKANVGPGVDCAACGEDQLSLLSANGDHQLKILELENHIEKNKTVLKCLQNLDCAVKRFDAIEQIEDALTGLKVIEFDGKCIRLSLRTYIPNLESLHCQPNIKDIIEQSEVNHELLIEVVDGTMEPKSVEIFPNDVYIGDIIDAAKSFRQSFSSLPMLETRSTLEWFVGNVQDRIVLYTLRRFMVRAANKSRHSFEYLDRDETVIAHMVGGVDAFIKLTQGWPLSNFPLKLISLKSIDNHLKGISLSFLCKVQEAVNSLDVHIRQNLKSFVDAIEKILVEQMHSELHSRDIPTK